ncbi:unnamed protein product [Adineta ricciae]|uniref:G-protein coupled receptors family 1 profile domain-containing protein n=1 Tax=Adineta ricciae TaxID=249248 RepID=A0A814XFV6_ADIRI|nr:unnamed protein product [Adineta ricciae]CAF1363240.1 unnamed protein product [Adineta ricciae]
MTTAEQTDTMSTTTDPSDSLDTSIIYIRSSIVILIWFEIVTACLLYGLGFLGNILSLIIFYSLGEFRRISTGYFFLLTTISNSFHLWTLSTEFLGIFNIYIYPDAFLQCRLNFFVQNVSRAISTYLATGIALDRLIRSELPLRSRVICTRRNAAIYTLVCLITFACIWSLWLCPEITQNPTTGQCIYNKSPVLYFYLTQVQSPARFILVCIIPVIVMIAANIRMLYNMHQSHRRVAHHAETVTAVMAQPALLTQKRTFRRMTALDRMLFYMMVANVGTFIVTQIPFHVYTLVRVYYPILDQFTHSLVRAMLLIWSSLYFGLGFYLYCFASPLFREKFVMFSKKLFQCFQRR